MKFSTRNGKGFFLEIEVSTRNGKGFNWKWRFLPETEKDLTGNRGFYWKQKRI